MIKENIIKNKTFEFALRIVKLTRYLMTEHKEFIMSKQLLRSGTSIGANVREAEHGESRADFIHKMSVALKEANESDYWLELLYRSDYITKVQYVSIHGNLVEILKMLITIVKSSKTRRI